MHLLALVKTLLLQKQILVFLELYGALYLPDASLQEAENLKNIQHGINFYCYTYQTY